LVAVMSEIEHKHKVEKHQQKTTKTVNNMILVYPVQINSLVPNGAYYSLEDILNSLIPKLAYRNLLVLKIEEIVHVKLNGIDSR
ncbi:3719_t:CDS:1, partial [Gigaspora margarita]